MTPDVTAGWLDEEYVAPPVSRMLLVVVALLGIFVAGYLTLHRFGFIGTLQCSVLGGCETVQASAYAFFPPRTLVPWGVSVALIGLLGYIVLFVLGLIGLQPAYVRSPWVARALLALSGFAFASGPSGLSFSSLAIFCSAINRALRRYLWIRARPAPAISRVCR